MSIRARLLRLEREAHPPPYDDPDAEAKANWQWFYRWFEEVLAAYPDALALLRQRVSANLCTWESGAKSEVKLWLLCSTAWHALEGFTDAKQTAEEAFAQLESR